MRKLAVIMQLPEGKLPGYYAQVIKALATKAKIYDRMKEILIIEHIEELPPIEQILEQYNIPYEIIPLLQLPSSAIVKAHYEDFGFTTSSDHTYLYEDSLILFTFKHMLEHTEDYSMAFIQLDEHLIASFMDGANHYYMAEKHLADCIFGIAKAYQCIFKTVDYIAGPLESRL